jgi:ribosomal protein S18 acetylase RimI-like enzyme
MNIIFRTTPRIEDADRIKEIIKSTGFFHHHEIEVAVELLHDRLSEGDHGHYQFLFAEIDGIVAGYACYGLIACTKSSFDLYWLATHDDFRGKGIGKKILDEMYRHIKEMGGTAVYAETSEREQYAPTRMFYEKTGYTKEAVLKDFYDKDDSKAIYVIHI